ncbi:MAG TPA: glycosyltransferase [Acetobacteraceae bacterium]|nr:glycosyltransferase [Acetobacteraceae bacterium]
MRFVFFTESLISCWNHGNAHFLRGVIRALLRNGHEVRSFEPADGWSRQNLVRDHGARALGRFAEDFPELATVPDLAGDDLDAMLDGANVVIVHEWTDHKLVAAIGRARKQGGRFTLLFHDTHHRMVSDPASMTAYDLSGYDGVLAFGESLAVKYRAQGWGDRVFVWHEAADVELFKPPAREGEREGAVWIGNWGDDERSDTLRAFMFQPAASAGIPLDIYGVRYPRAALDELAAKGIRYHGWAANADAPGIFARHMMTVHVPRRFYQENLPGIPTIRMFEAMACGIPLLSAPWRDTESLFTAGEDYLLAETPQRMEANMRDVAHDEALRQSLAAHGLATIRARHSCAHRADELLEILNKLRHPALAETC